MKLDIWWLLFGSVLEEVALFKQSKLSFKCLKF